MKFSIFCFIISLILSSCILHRQKHVWLGSLQRTHLVQDTNVHRVYLDKWGNFYPSDDLHIPYDSFFDPRITGNPRKNLMENGNLEKYYIINKHKLNELANYYKVDNNFPDETERFYAIQDTICNRNINQIRNLFKNKSEKLLIVLIHGLNDPDPSGDYEQLRKKLKELKYVTDSTVYIEVYWDGLTANQAHPARSGIWGRAQHNSAYASLSLRKILEGLPTDTKIRIITHSLGASVGTGALFNTTSKWNLKESDVKNFDEKKKKWDYFSLVKKTDVPKQPDIRIGMFAPAIPGESTFKDFLYRGDTEINVDKNNVSKIVIGYNENDYAVSKRAGGKDYLASKAGSTSLGCNLILKGESEIERSIRAIKAPGVIESTNFTQYPGTKQMEQHGLYYYLINPNSTEFFRKLFN